MNSLPETVSLCTSHRKRATTWLDAVRLSLHTVQQADCHQETGSLLTLVFLFLSFFLVCLWWWWPCFWGSCGCRALYNYSTASWRCIIRQKQMPLVHCYPTLLTILRQDACKLLYMWKREVGVGENRGGTTGSTSSPGKARCSESGTTIRRCASTDAIADTQCMLALQGSQLWTVPHPLKGDPSPYKLPTYLLQASAPWLTWSESGASDADFILVPCTLPPVVIFLCHDLDSSCSIISKSCQSWESSMYVKCSSISWVYSLHDECSSASGIYSIHDNTFQTPWPNCYSMERPWSAQCNMVTKCSSVSWVYSTQATALAYLCMVSVGVYLRCTIYMVGLVVYLGCTVYMVSLVAYLGCIVCMTSLVVYLGCAVYIVSVVVYLGCTVCMVGIVKVFFGGKMNHSCHTAVPHQLPYQWHLKTSSVVPKMYTEIFGSTYLLFNACLEHFR